MGRRPARAGRRVLDPERRARRAAPSSVGAIARDVVASRGHGGDALAFMRARLRPEHELHTIAAWLVRVG
jgi:hypothetical protein